MPWDGGGGGGESGGQRHKEEGQRLEGTETQREANPRKRSRGQDETGGGEIETQGRGD